MLSLPAGGLISAFRPPHSKKAHWMELCVSLFYRLTAVAHAITLPNDHEQILEGTLCYQDISIVQAKTYVMRYKTYFKNPRQA